MISYEAVFLPLSAALGLLGIVERILEFFKNFVEPLINPCGLRVVPKLSGTLEKIDGLEKLYEDSKDDHDKECTEGF